MTKKEYKTNEYLTELFTKNKDKVNRQQFRMTNDYASK